MPMQMEFCSAILNKTKHQNNCIFNIPILKIFIKYNAIEASKENVGKILLLNKTISVAFKDNFFRNRMLALEFVPEDAKDFLADVEKLAQNDPKTFGSRSSNRSFGKN